MSSTLDATLAWVHIFSAIAWMGTAMFVSMVMGPLMPRLSTSTRQELVLKLLPRLSRYVLIFAVLTIVIGVVLSLSHVGGDLQLLSPNTTWGLRITVGATLSLIALILGPVMVSYTIRRMVGLVRETEGSSQPGANPELARLQRRMRILATSVLALLTVVLVFMVAATRLS